MCVFCVNQLEESLDFGIPCPRFHHFMHLSPFFPNKNFQVPVMYTSPKNLKRVVGGGPGMVQVSKEKIVWGRPSEGEAIVRRRLVEAEGV
jgi:hypothetical protein